MGWGRCGSRGFRTNQSRSQTNLHKARVRLVGLESESVISLDLCVATTRAVRNCCPVRMDIKWKVALSEEE